MPENHSRAGKTVERVKITDEPHDKYSGIHPLTGEEITDSDGIPVLLTVPGGKIVKKDITYYTVKCPECKVPAKYTHDSEPVCPQCGIICSGKQTILSEQMVRDAKGAGRINDEKAGTSA